MNWQETVLSDEELGEIIRRNQTGRPFKNESGIARDSTQAQAQATWQARQPEVDEARKQGYDEGVADRLSLEDALNQRIQQLKVEVDEAEQRGIRKVKECSTFQKFLWFADNVPCISVLTGSEVADCECATCLVKKMQAFLKGVEKRMLE